MATPKKKEKNDELFRTVDEIVEKYFPNRVERDHPRPGDLGRRLADQAIERISKGLSTKIKKK